MPDPARFVAVISRGGLPLRGTAAPKAGPATFVSIADPLGAWHPERFVESRIDASVVAEASPTARASTFAAATSKDAVAAVAPVSPVNSALTEASPTARATAFAAATRAGPVAAVVPVSPDTAGSVARPSLPSSRRGKPASGPVPATPSRADRSWPKPRGSRVDSDWNVAGLSFETVLAGVMRASASANRLPAGRPLFARPFSPRASPRPHLERATKARSFGCFMTSGPGLLDLPKAGTPGHRRCVPAPRSGKKFRCPAGMSALLRPPGKKRATRSPPTPPRAST